MCIFIAHFQVGSRTAYVTQIRKKGTQITRPDRNAKDIASGSGAIRRVRKSRRNIPDQDTAEAGVPDIGTYRKLWEPANAFDEMAIKIL